MKKEIKTRQQLIERLNDIDRKCIDEGRFFHDLKTLFESKEYKLSAQDKADIKKVASIEDDPETLKAYIDSKAVEESLEEVYYGEWEKYGFKNGNEFNDAFKAWCEKQYWKGFDPDEPDISDEEYDELQDAFIASLKGESTVKTQAQDEEEIKDTWDNFQYKQYRVVLDIFGKDYGIYDPATRRVIASGFKDAESAKAEIDKMEESLNETILSPEEEYDYFEVLDDDGELVGEYPSYEDAKNACVDDSYHIYGVEQYGGAEYGETLIEADEEKSEEQEPICYDISALIDINTTIYNNYIEDDTVDYIMDIFKERDIDTVIYESEEELKRLLTKNFEDMGLIEDFDVDVSVSFLDWSNLDCDIYVEIPSSKSNQVEKILEDIKESINNFYMKFDVEVEYDDNYRDVDDWDTFEVNVEVEITINVEKVRPCT